MSTSPTSRSLKHLRDDGWTAEVVEKWVPGANVRRDLFGFIDIVAIRGAETMGVQTTDYTSVSKRITKIAESPLIAAVRAAGWSIRVHGWKRNKAGRWELARDVDVS